MSNLTTEQLLLELIQQMSQLTEAMSLLAQSNQDMANALASMVDSAEYEESQAHSGYLSDLN